MFTATDEVCMRLLSLVIGLLRETLIAYINLIEDEFKFSL